MKEGEPPHISKTDLARLNRTAKIAATSKHHRFKIGATLWKGGRYIAGSPNHIRGGPDVPPGRFSVHAEVACLNQASGSSLRSGGLFVVRLDAYDCLMLSRPCPYCLDRIRRYEISRIVYSAGFGKFECINL